MQGVGASVEQGRRPQVTPVVGPWWLFLLTGIFWFVVALIVLRFRLNSLVAVSVLLGTAFIGAAVNEFAIAWIRRGWRWMHILLGVLFVAGASWAFVRPLATFWSLASVLGFLLLFKGMADITSAVVTREGNDLWWLGVTVGILEILLAFWASQQLFPARAALIVLWVGFLALFRGLTEIVLAFHLRHVERTGSPASLLRGPN